MMEIIHLVAMACLASMLAGISFYGIYYGTAYYLDKRAFKRKRNSLYPESTNDRSNISDEATRAALPNQSYDLLNLDQQRFETNELLIETVRLGMGVKIKWHFTGEAPIGFELLGYRKTGGFFPDTYDEQHNGTLVANNYDDGEIIEFLKPEEANYYTFFLARQGYVYRTKCSSIRFQITIASKEATEAIKALHQTLDREETTDPREKMSKAIDELDLVVEFHDAMDATEQALVAKIKSKNLSKEEERERIEFIRDMVRHQREKFQP